MGASNFRMTTVEAELAARALPGIALAASTAKPWTIPRGGCIKNRLLLAIDCRMMSARYRFSRRLSIETASRALEEMALVVAHFANTIGEGGHP